MQAGRTRERQAATKRGPVRLSDCDAHAETPALYREGGRTQQPAADRRPQTTSGVLHCSIAQALLRGAEQPGRRCADGVLCHAVQRALFQSSRAWATRTRGAIEPHGGKHPPSASPPPSVPRRASAVPWRHLSALVARAPRRCRHGAHARRRQVTRFHCFRRFARSRGGVHQPRGAGAGAGACARGRAAAGARRVPGVARLGALKRRDRRLRLFPL